MSSRFDFGSAYLTSLAASILASVLTIVYVGGNLATESNPVTATLIAEFGLGPAMAIRTLAVVVLYHGYYAVGAATGTGRAAVRFAWLGAAVNGLDALGNVAVALALGPAFVPYEQLWMVPVLAGLGWFAIRVRPPATIEPA